ncbi:pyridoxamine 5'-phosphate oxidase [Aestuariibius insulae]|uniref:pyridoxamine 5'-phosphate oxidase n=1 Tax=Aestuariibius insulae TaxID=2058287 RepID=UPI00345EB1EC
MGNEERHTDRVGIFAGSDPIALVMDWLADAERSEPEDANAMALATVDAAGLPNVRIVLLKEIEPTTENGGAFLFYTNYESSKAQEIETAGRAAFVLHWKTLRRQVRVRGSVRREDGPKADAYYQSRAPGSRIGAWTSQQSKPLASRAALLQERDDTIAKLGDEPGRPPFWGGFRITPVEIEFWADGADRLHDRFLWTRQTAADPWTVSRLYP